MNKIFLLCLFIAVAFSSPLFRLDGGKVQVDFYYESLCPYCQQFIERSLRAAADTKDFWKICDFNLYPYGNARRAQNGSSWTFTCQHGVKECQGNLIETCAIKLYDFYSQALPFVICLEANTTNWITQGQKCSSQLSLDWNKINNCATSEQGIQYEVEMAKATEALNPAHQYVPWIVVNGKHSQSAESAIENNMVRYVCSIYTGSEKIAACQ